MIMRLKKFFKRNSENIWGFIRFALFITALTLIFKVAPNIANYICNVEEETMTTFVEWFMCVIFALALLTDFLSLKNKGGKKDENK